MPSKSGKVIVPAGTSIWPHEMRCARTLAAAGHNIEFLTPIEGPKIKTADLIMDNIRWEIKSPESSNLKSLQRVLRRAGLQSPNVIIDTTRATKLSDSAILRELKRLFPMTKSVRRLVVVTKNGDVIDIGKS